MSVIGPKDGDKFSKFGVDFIQYIGQESDDIDILTEKTEHGHLEEFYNTECTFYYYILEGEGEFYLDGEPREVEKGDLVKVPPGTRTYYLGEMEILLVSHPSWSEEQEVHVRHVDEDGNTVEKPYSER